MASNLKPNLKITKKMARKWVKWETPDKVSTGNSEFTKVRLGW